MARKGFTQVTTTKKARGETWYGRLVRFKPDTVVKVVPLINLTEALTVWTRRKQVGYRGAFLDVVCGRNAALEMDVPDPFNEHPVEEWRRVKPVTYLPVLVLSGDDEMVGKVGAIALKKTMKEALEGWLSTMKEMDGTDASIQDQIVTIIRKGTGTTDTSYQTTVVKPYTHADMEAVDAAYNEYFDMLVNGLRSQADLLPELYKATLGGFVPPATEEKTQETPAAVETDEIDF